MERLEVTRLGTEGKTTDVEGFELHVSVRWDVELADNYCLFRVIAMEIRGNIGALCTSDASRPPAHPLG